MAKKQPKTEEAVAVENNGEAAVGTDQSAEKPAPAPKSRGPRGVLETAKITLVKAENPKRPGSKAHDAYSKYKDQMTVGEFADAVGKDATPHMVYDAAHGFITIEGYDPGAIITPKPKKEKAVKEPKAPKAKKASAADGPAPQTTAEVDALATEETLD